MKKIAILICLFMSFSAFADALKPVVEKKNVYIGEELNIKVEIPPAKNMSAKFLKENSDMAITGVTPAPDGKALTIKLITLKEGELEVPEIELTLDGSIMNVGSFNITSQNRTQESDMKLRDIKEPVKIMEKDYTFIYVFAGLLIIIAFFFLIRYLMRKLRKNKPVPVFQISPFEVAAQYLKEAKIKRENGDLESFTDLVTFGLKTYMSLKCKANYREMTTYEIRRELKRDKLFSKFDKRIIDLLKVGDRFKFADEQLDDSDFDMIVSEFENIVNEIEKSGVNSNAVS
ncbi:MAG TPA: hypothetical protein PKG52_01360 [bacterium]|nr:hypothetical protein [bacterium]HPS29222.1 hypothetical protein [bacterium]